MKLYEYQNFPNPRRVRIFLAEKGITVAGEQVDVPAGEHRQEAYLRKNPYATVPALELDDGTCISETVAICRYFEARYPDPPLMGQGAENAAKVEMWQRRVEQTLMDTAVTYFHQGTEGLGALELYQNREWGLENRKRFISAMHKIDGHLEGKKYIVDDGFSIADITGFCALDFAKLIGIEIPDDCLNVARWYQAVASRPAVNG